MCKVQCHVFDITNHVTVFIYVSETYFNINNIVYVLLLRAQLYWELNLCSDKMYVDGTGKIADRN